MDSKDHKIAPASSVHEGHGVHLCHRCGWPFPNPHPSAKHRRAHKRVCGTIEGYTVIHSEEHDHHLNASDDDRDSDEDEHTPSPVPMEKNIGRSGSSVGVGEMSNRSEEDVFTDAATEFSDSGISPQSLERLGSTKGFDKGAEQKSTESGFHGIDSLKVNETADKTEPYNDSTNGKETTNPGALVNDNDQSGTVLPVTDSRAETVAVGLGNGVQDGSVKSEILRDVVDDNVNKCDSGEIQLDQRRAGEDSNIQGEEPKFGFANFDSKDGIISDPALMAVERKEELHDKLDPEMVKPTFQNKDASAEVKSVPVYAEISCSSRTVDDTALTKETHENTNASSGVEKVSASAEGVESVGVAEGFLPVESLLSRSLAEPTESTLSPDVAQPSDPAFSIKEEIKEKSCSIEVETAGKSGLAEVETAEHDAREGEECNAGGNENDEQKSVHKYLIDTVSALGSSDKTVSGEDNQMNVLKGDVNYCEEKSVRTSLVAAIEKGEDSEEVKGILNSTICMDESTNFPCAREADGSTKNVEEPPKAKSDTVDSYLETSFQGQSPDKLNEKSHKFGSTGMETGANHNVGVSGKDSVTATSEYHVSQEISECKIHVPGDVGLDSAPVAGIVEEIKDTRGIVASESTPEQPISKEPTFTDPELLNENFAKETRCNEKGDRELDDAKVSTELNHGCNVDDTKILEGPNHTQQESLSAQTCSNGTSDVEKRLAGMSETSPDAEERHIIEDNSTSKPFGIVLNAAQTSDGNFATSEKCFPTPSLEEAVPSSLHFQELHETSATGDDKNVINVEPIVSANSKSLQREGEDKLQDNSSVKSASLDGNCEAVSAVAKTNSLSSDPSTASLQQDETTTEEAHDSKSDDFEPPSFMTLVESGDKSDHVSSASEIESVQNNQQPKSDALQAGWFPSLTNVVNESEGRKKNEQIIARVTNSSPVKHHSPLKNLLNEAKSPKEVSATNLKNETEPKSNGAGGTIVGSVASPGAPAPNDHDTHKDIDEWHSPARYPMETKKEKKKTKSYWVPFMCCSSVHKDL